MASFHASGAHGKAGRPHSEFRAAADYPSLCQRSTCRRHAHPQTYLCAQVTRHPEVSGKVVFYVDMVQCIYCSKSVDTQLSADELESILDQSRVNNERIDVTGMLLYESGAFFQVLEGDRNVVEELYQRLEGDERHQNVIKLIVEPIEERNFGTWSMGYPKVSRAELAQIDGLNDFFSQGKSFVELEEGRAKTLLEAFKGGRWH